MKIFRRHETHFFFIPKVTILTDEVKKKKVKNKIPITIAAIRVERLEKLS